ncbi:peptidase domain-containing ABC transporter [Chitinophaga caseinilytica]|uniref:Peptidase domain-containing ABC transporter n=1 Tax=Chitinophaga caseinilytica TaxID=2267521 RepID=A0ABZ2Z3P9_9BACT
MSFHFYRQLNAMDCGPTCLRMVARSHGKHYNVDTIRRQTGLGKQGVSMLSIGESAEKMGFRTRGVQIDYEKLQQVPVPAILHWNHNHFVVMIDAGKRNVKIADPASGIISYKKEEFMRRWTTNINADDRSVGTALLLEPKPEFFQAEDEKEHKLNWGFLFNYLRGARGPLIQIFISLGIGLILQTVMPFLSQSMVDNGINANNLNYITLVLIAQLMLVFSTTLINFIRNRLQLRVTGRINIALLSDFWIKLNRLPLSYFDTRQTGDTLQRLSDNRQIQAFLTGQTINTIFSLISFVIYAAILMLYSPGLFVIFLIGSVLYFTWIRLFMKLRRKINEEQFAASAREKSASLEMIQGVQEIRLGNAEQLKRWEWENIQSKMFRLNFRNLGYNQLQSAGALLINQSKDILLTFSVAKLVVDGQLTFGAMLSIQYILGQLSAPVQQFVGLFQQYQDAKISLERLNEINLLDDEEPDGKSFVTQLPVPCQIRLQHVNFTYPGAGNPVVLNNVSLEIPQGKVTAIVGDSGSGKTTIIKLLLRIYQEYQGNITIGNHDLQNISPAFWRRQCGAVLQDSFIFNDTIARNIALGEEVIDEERLAYSCRVSNILPFIESLPNGFNTKLGAEGVGMSQGQRQRLFIARAVYKDPAFLFFDEATNALDANNEKTIVENLDRFFRGRTVLVVAHRLSTVKNADKIIVLKQGKIIEEGTHFELIELKNHYYELVKNQLELAR